MFTDMSRKELARKALKHKGTPLGNRLARILAMDEMEKEWRDVTGLEDEKDEQVFSDFWGPINNGDIQSYINELIEAYYKADDSISSGTVRDHLDSFNNDVLPLLNEAVKALNALRPEIRRDKYLFDGMP